MGQRGKFLAGNFFNDQNGYGRAPRRKPATVTPPKGNAIFTAISKAEAEYSA